MAGTAMAKLPPPAAEDQAKAEKKKEDAKADEERQKKETADVQDRIVRRYRSEHAQAAPPAGRVRLAEGNGRALGRQGPRRPHPDTGR